MTKYKTLLPGGIQEFMHDLRLEHARFVSIKDADGNNHSSSDTITFSLVDNRESYCTLSRADAIDLARTILFLFGEGDEQTSTDSEWEKELTT